MATRGRGRYGQARVAAHRQILLSATQLLAEAKEPMIAPRPASVEVRFRLVRSPLTPRTLDDRATLYRALLPHVTPPLSLHFGHRSVNPLYPLLFVGH
ncbi:hypothetical protein BHE74_00006167 [Ensete ventricosum]|uniref:Uncharacterized protein n=1 Tax=Ensete ventricosum TaxID=4639 RepID=A0A445MIG3_ENSVE|nr:hypothetical protein BHE74_00006167 [Ensete ventricosum]RZR74045.1 hypothetical protein BHM03_00031485 [Ensete ventricosum]